MNLAFPFRFADSGATATTDHAGWVRGLIEQLLLTAPGERVMRPEFGSGALHLVFAPNAPELAAAVRLLIEAAVRRDLAEVLTVDSLDVTAEADTLRIHLAYRLLATGEAVEDSFAIAAPGAGL
jgi:uncharacterized protein